MVIARGHGVTHVVHRAACLVGRAHGVFSNRRLGRDLLETVDAGDLFDQVFLDLDVETVRRRLDHEHIAVHAERETEALEHIRHDFVRQRNTEHTRGTRHAHAHRLALGAIDDLIVDRAGLAAADIEDQRADALDVFDDGRIVDAALEAVAGVGREVVAARAPLDGGGPPERGLDVDVLRVERDGGLVAAHDAGQAFDGLLVRDHANLVIDGDGVAVQQLQLLTGLAPAHRQAAMNLVQVEHVRRTAQFQHHIVGDVDQRRYAAHARALDARHHPCRRLRTRIDAADDATRKAAAQVRRLHLDRQLVGERHCHRRHRRQRDRRARQRGHLARHAVDRQAVRLVGRELDDEDLVVQVQHLADVRAHRRVFRQDQQAAALFRQLQLARRAQHAVALHTAQLADLDLERLAVVARRQLGAHQCARHLDAHRHIRGAADDLQQLARAGIHLADVQAIGVRVLVHLDHVADNDLRERRRDGIDLFHLETGHRQAMGELSGGDRRIDETAKPGFRKLHGATEKGIR